MNSPTIILVRPREQGNVGAVARAMANMGLDRLVLVEPAPELGGVARGFGVGGWEILDSVIRKPSFDEAVAPFGRLVATASRRQRRLHRHRVLAPRELSATLNADPPGTETALVFGPEDSGLKREELERCNPVITIPCSRDQPTLNLAQSVLILAYELFVVDQPDENLGLDAGPRPESVAVKDPLATSAEIRALEQQVDTLLPRFGYDQTTIRAGLLRDLLRLLTRSDPSEREVRILRSLCNRAAGFQETQRRRRS